MAIPVQGNSILQHLAVAMENGERDAHVRLSLLTSMRVVSTAEYTCKAVPIEVNGESRTCMATSQFSAASAGYCKT